MYLIFCAIEATYTESINSQAGWAAQVRDMMVIKWFLHNVAGLVRWFLFKRGAVFASLVGRNE